MGFLGGGQRKIIAKQKQTAAQQQPRTAPVNTRTIDLETCQIFFTILIHRISDSDQNTEISQPSPDINTHCPL